MPLYLDLLIDKKEKIDKDKAFGKEVSFAAKSTQELMQEHRPGNTLSCRDG